MTKKHHGKLIVIDGLDGSGKATQTKLLVRHLKKLGCTVRTLDFPQYEKNFFGSFISTCLHTSKNFIKTDPQITSVLYAADRWESKEKIKKWLAKGYTVILDRYVSANQIHQGGKISHPKKRKEFMEWLHKMEYDVFKMPKPDLILYLDVDTEISQELLKNSHKKLDTAETDLEYLTHSRKSALWLSRHEKNWKKVLCTKNRKIKNKEEIHKIICALYRDIFSK